MQFGKVIKTGNCRRACCVLRAEETLVVNHFPSNRLVSHGADSPEKLNLCQCLQYKDKGILFQWIVIQGSKYCGLCC